MSYHCFRVLSGLIVSATSSHCSCFKDAIGEVEGGQGARKSLFAPLFEAVRKNLQQCLAAAVVLSFSDTYRLSVGLPTGIDLSFRYFLVVYTD